jgi:serine/threonine-protein kinase
MHQVLEALIDENGRVFLAEPALFAGTRRALVIVLDDGTAPPITRTPVPCQQSEGVTRYRIERPLGEGGMGQAFVATDLQTGRTVCVKRLRPGLREELIVQEWRSLSRVDSRYVVRFLDRYDHGGTLHIVMEYVDGPTLADRLRSGLSANEIAWLGLGLMRGVQAFHQLDVIHCDLKPQNVLLQEETLFRPGEPGWTPKIIDFGLAVLDRHDADGCATAEGRIAGTPAYMAPEQVNGWVLSPACDVYAVGLILWEVLAGRRAFTGDTYAIRAAKVAQTAGLRLEGVAVTVPPDVVELVARCTHPHPSHRPSAAAAAAVLEQWVASAPNQMQQTWPATLAPEDT